MKDFNKTSLLLSEIRRISNFTLVTSMLIFAWMTCSTEVRAQYAEKEIVISGARFTGDLLKYWIKEYSEVNPSVKFKIEDKGTVEYSEADIIIHGHQPSKTEDSENRIFLSFARYAVLPIANKNSSFAKTYGEKGLKKSELKQVFFFNPLDRIDEKPLKVAFNVYSRIQQASSPIVFAKTFGYVQTDLHGRLISGTDNHLVQAVCKDSLGVSYAPIPLIYDLNSGLLKEGLVVIPIDADDNGKLSNEENSYKDLASVLNFLKKEKYKNIPVSEIQFSIKKQGSGQEVNQFLTWVFSKGLDVLEDYGYLSNEEKTIEQNISNLSKYAN